MQLTTYAKPLFVEELVFEVKPDKIQDYLKADYEIFTKELSACKGFVGSEIWVSKTKPGYVRNIVFWEDIESFREVDSAWVARADAKLKSLIGEDNIRFVESAHAKNEMSKVCECR